MSIEDENIDMMVQESIISKRFQQTRAQEMIKRVNTSTPASQDAKIASEIAPTPDIN